MLKHRKAPLLFLLAACLGGCAAATDDPSRETLPSYAVPINNNMGWSVTCPLRTITNPLNRNYEIFRNEDGSTKSFEQFCAENDSSRRSSP